MRQIKKIVVVGGGTAGWLSACYMNKFFPDSQVTVVESDKIDTIGVGESTTPPFLDLLKILEVPIQDLINEAGITFKSSIKFTNWTGDGSYYHHGFGVELESLQMFNGTYESVFTSPPKLSTNFRFDLATLEIFKSKNLDDIHFSSVVAEKNKVPVFYNDNNELMVAANMGLHINAINFAKYMKKFGIAKGIISKIDTVKTAIQDDNGFIIKLILDNETIDTDFVIDCTGFSRFFVDKLFKSKFESYKDYLPLKRAAPFFIDLTEKIPPYTEAKAMKYGWTWKVPLQDRYGCGYVFDSDFVTDEDIHRELCEEFDQDIKINKFINFEPGYYLSPWNKNVLAVGLSSGFIEPLEATSLWIINISLTCLNKFLEGAFYGDQRNIDSYNKLFNDAVRSLRDLIQLHYLGDRKDTEFWKTLRSNIKLTDFTSNYMEILKYRMPNAVDFSAFNMFSLENWLVLSAGLNHFNKDIVEQNIISYNIEKNLSSYSKEFKFNLNKVADRCLEHENFIKLMRSIN